MASVNAISGDSLEQDFLLEDSFAFDAQSDDEIDLNADLSTALYDSDSELPPAPVAAPIVDEDESRPAKKARKEASEKKELTEEGRKRKGEKKEKTKAAKKLKMLATEVEEVISLGTLPGALLAERVAEKQRRALPKLSGIEMEDLRIAESMFVDTSSVVDRKSLLTFIREAIPTLPSTLAKPPKKVGSPRVIVIAGAALRVADLCREVKPYKTKDIDVAKLFSKHFKLQEHIEYLQKTKVGIAVGTPGRIGKLFSESDSLSLNHLSHLILDVTHLDAKKRSLLDMPEGREELFKLVLGHKAVMDRLREGRMKVVLF